MKKYLSLPVVLALASIASFGSHSQSRFSSQFHVPHVAKHIQTDSYSVDRSGRLGTDRSLHNSRELANRSRRTHFAHTRPVSRKGAAAATIGFVSAPEIPAGGTPENDTFQADVNGNGKLDIVSVIYDLTTLDGYGISVALGNGDGTFQAPVRTLLPDNDPILVGDLNGDGKADVIQVHPGSPSTFDVWIADANGDAGLPMPSKAPPLASRTLIYKAASLPISTAMENSTYSPSITTMSLRSGHCSATGTEPSRPAPPRTCLGLRPAISADRR